MATLWVSTLNTIEVSKNKSWETVDHIGHSTVPNISLKAGEFDYYGK